MMFKGDNMNYPIVLMYNLQNSKGAKIKMICHKMNIPFKSVEKSEYSLRICDLLESKSAENADNFSDFNDEMLLIANFSRQMLNDFLKRLSSAKAPVALKAVLTEHNSLFTSSKLYNEISSEHNALKEGKTIH